MFEFTGDLRGQGKVNATGYGGPAGRATMAGGRRAGYGTDLCIPTTS